MSNGEYQPHDYFIWYKNSFLLVVEVDPFEPTGGALNSHRMPKEGE